MLNAAHVRHDAAMLWALSCASSSVALQIHATLRLPFAALSSIVSANAPCVFVLFIAMPLVNNSDYCNRYHVVEGSGQHEHAHKDKD
jgi:hypothetical protein